LRDRSAALLRRLGATPPRNASASNSMATLTAREVEILDGLRQGDSNAQIAGRLVLSPKTVEHHVSRIFVKLGVRTRAEAAAVAASAGPLAGGKNRTARPSARPGSGANFSPHRQWKDAPAGAGSGRSP
jgi:DNA-binding CsgD family transcriptional regulator